ncbi:MAG: SEC-C metal-binding domain-containing protein, partial [Patescibacteria group bacterium]
LMRLFGGERLKMMMERLKVPDDMPLESRMVSRSIEGAQKKVEGRNFDIRRHVLQYDDVMNRHRDIIYKRRQKVLEKIALSPTPTPSPEGGGEHADRSSSSPLHQEVLEGMAKEIESILAAHAASEDPEEWNAKEIVESLAALHRDFGQVVTEESVKKFTGREELGSSLVKLLQEAYEAKCGQFDAETVRNAENLVTLRSIDTHWMDHIDDMSHLREQVAFSGYAQRDPVIEYQDQGFRRFQQLLATVNTTMVRTLLQVDFAQFAPRAVQLMEAEEDRADMQTNADQIEGELTQTGVSAAAFTPPTVRPAGPSPDVSGQAPVPSQRVKAEQKARSVPKVGRNDPCPCGSGKKYKKCHGRGQ